MALLSIGVRCNNCCIMCTTLQPPPRGGWNRSTKQLEEVVLKFNKNESQVAITGGEATIRPDFFHILRFIKKNMPNSEIVLLTNGRMFHYRQFTKDFVETGCDSVAIPLHAADAKLHDKITRAPGSFKQTVQGIKNLLEYSDRVNIEIRVVIHRLNYRHIPEIASFISNEFKGIQRIVLFPIDIIGNANINRKELIAKVTDIKPYLERGLDILEKSGFEFSLYHIPFCVIDEKYWKNVAGRTVEPVRITFKPCDECTMKESCSGIWKTYAFRVGTAEFHPIKSL